MSAISLTHSNATTKFFPTVQLLLNGLENSRKDVERNFSILTGIVREQQDTPLERQALQFLQQQTTLKKVVQRLIEQLHSLRRNAIAQVAGKSFHQLKSSFEQLAELTTQTEIFYEMQFRVKKSSLSFIAGNTPRQAVRIIALNRPMAA